MDLDLTLLEMNPFTFDANGNPFPLDMRVELDDTAGYRSARKWGDLEFPNPFGERLALHAVFCFSGNFVKFKTHAVVSWMFQKNPENPVRSA